MKQPIPGEKALLYRLDAGTEKGDGVRRVLRAMNVAIVDLAPDMLNQTVGHCAGLPGFGSTGEPDPGEAPVDDVLIMAGFSDDRISQLLSQLRAAGLPRIGLMATVTEHNRGWTLASLMTELACERRLMGAWMSLQQTVKAAEAQAENQSETRSGARTGSGFGQALAAARDILGSEEPPDPETIRQADAALRAFLPGPDTQGT